MKGRRRISVVTCFVVGFIASISYMRNVTVLLMHSAQEGTQTDLSPASSLRRAQHIDKKRTRHGRVVAKPELMEVIDGSAVQSQHTALDERQAFNATEIDSLPPPMERAPAFIIAGAQKSGTQALRYHLSKHPLVEVPTRTPETHFFDKYYSTNRTPAQNLARYNQHFFDKDCTNPDNTCISGESTPIYLYDTTRVPSQLHAACKWCKLLIVLRDPVKRAFSHFNMLTLKNEINASFDEWLELDLNWMKEVGLIRNFTMSHKDEDQAWRSYQKHLLWRRLMLGRGMYEVQLREWFKYFPRKQFLILHSDDLKKNRIATMSRVYHFLRLPEHHVPSDHNIHVRSYSSPTSNETEIFLYDFYRPYNKRLSRLLGPDWKAVWERQ